jgi:hypothetical protein
MAHVQGLECLTSRAVWPAHRVQGEEGSRAYRAITVIGRAPLQASDRTHYRHLSVHPIDGFDVVGSARKPHHQSLQGTTLKPSTHNHASI